MLDIDYDNPYPLGSYVPDPNQPKNPPRPRKKGSGVTPKAPRRGKKEEKPAPATEQASAPAEKKPEGEQSQAPKRRRRRRRRKSSSASSTPNQES